MVPKLSNSVLVRALTVGLFIGLMFPCLVLAEKRISAYFFNDSVNGLIISDAYETHNMGIVYEFGNRFVSLDLGIVSPDMHVYRNQYRKANQFETYSGDSLVNSLGDITSCLFGFLIASISPAAAIAYIGVSETLLWPNGIIGGIYYLF